MKNIKKLYNLNYLDVTNKTHKVGNYDLPYVYCKSSILPDYFALYSEVKDYHKTSRTCVCFFQDDIKFDGLCGLWNAIYYGDDDLLDYYRQRFKNVQFMIAPDYSLVEDIENFENYYRLAKARIVSVWLTVELGIICFPLLSFSKKEDFPLMISGMDDVATICVSLKGIMKSESRRELTKDAIGYAVDNLPGLKNILVYSVSAIPNNEQDFFKHAESKGISIVYPENSLRIRNRLKRANHHG